MVNCGKYHILEREKIIKTSYLFTYKIAYLAPKIRIYRQYLFLSTLASTYHIYHLGFGTRFRYREGQLSCHIFAERELEAPDYA